MPYKDSPPPLFKIGFCNPLRSPTVVFQGLQPFARSISVHHTPGIALSERFIPLLWSFAEKIHPTIHRVLPLPHALLEYKSYTSMLPEVLWNIFWGVFLLNLEQFFPSNCFIFLPETKFLLQPLPSPARRTKSNFPSALSR